MSIVIIENVYEKMRLLKVPLQFDLFVSLISNSFCEKSNLPTITLFNVWSNINRSENGNAENSCDRRDDGSPAHDQH